ncbi:DNA-binding NarL/FixJ family response regulator [Algoriphagus sp. 4150]|uniref:response regulator transcription factor n=1 Tax=Algoriphagus sp. 4150 TaxID=2817756 RepID=UPI00285588C2|nr:response regulator transcription factor [Algoriphagus sp. 4150]MDR7128125.1 DNA-binding NarL/FixJ family response regulator [Algoriphagus sp. 4150]
MSIRIALFDDNKNIRNSIRTILTTDPSFEVVGIFSDAQQCVERVVSVRPDVVIMDINIAGMNGIDAVSLLTREFPQIQILIQTVSEDDERIFDSICAGASGYILKNQLNSTLTCAINQMQNGGSPMSPSIARRVLNLLKHGYAAKKSAVNEEYNLTSREKEVLTALVSGSSYKMIAFELEISYETVRSHMKKIYEKLHVASLTEVVAKAINQNIV